MRILGMFLVLCGTLIFGSLMGAMVLLVWGLSTESGTRWLAERARESDLIELQFEHISGKVLGPLELQGFRFKTETVDVSLDRLSLAWRPIHLLQRRLRVDALEVGSLSVVLEQGEPPDAPADTPAIPDLPIEIELTRLRVGEVLVDLPPDDQGKRSRQRVEAIALDKFVWAGAELSVGRVAASHEFSGTVEAAVQSRLAQHSIELRQLEVQTVERSPLRLSSQGSVRLDGKPSRLSLNWEGLRWPLKGEPQVTSRSGKATLNGTPEDLAFTARLALGDTADLDARGRYAKSLLDADLKWTALQWPLSGEPSIASREGSLQFKGAPDKFRYQLDAQLAAQGQEGHATAKGRGSTEQLSLETLSLDVAGSRISGRGDVAWKSALRVDADLQLEEVDPGLVAADWPGKLNGTLLARTQMVEQTPEVRFELALQDSVLRGYPLALDAKGQALGTEVTLQQLTLDRGKTRITAQGRVTPPFAAQATLNSPDLLELWPQLGGRADLELSLQGPLRAPHLQVRGEMTSFQFGDALLDQLTLNADVDVEGQWDLDLVAKDLRSPSKVHQALVRLKGSANAHVLDIQVDAEQGRASLKASGALDIDAQQWRGEVSDGELAPKALAAWRMEEPAKLFLEQTFMQLEPACWRSQGDDASRLCLQGLRKDQRTRAALRADGLNLAYIGSLLPQGWQLQGGLDGTAVAEQRNGRWVEARADFTTQALQMSRGEEVVLSAAPGSLKVADNDRGTVATLRLPLEGGHIHFDAELAGDLPDYARRPLSSRLDVKIPDLRVLRVASTEIDHAAGSIEGAIQWTGSLAEPQAVGDMKLLGGEIHLATPGIRMTDIAGGFAVTPDQRVTLSASAKSGKGALRLEGAADLSAEPMTASLQVTGEEFQAVDTIEARAWISPDLKVSVLGQEIEVKGEVKVPRAEITPVNFESGVGPSSDQVIITPDSADPPSSGVELRTDINLVLGDDVRFEGFGLKTQFLGKLRVIEEPGRPGIGRGEIRMEGGQYKAYGQDLEIATGRVIYNAVPLNQPAVELRALRRPAEGIEVGVLVRGNLTDPEFQLFSSPAMPRERQLSWLVLGRAIDEGGGGDERQMLANAALAMGLSRTDKFAKGVAGGLKLDDISIGSAAGESADQASLTVGKYLSPKLYVSYGFGLFQPGQVFKLLYDLGRGFKVSTESGVHTGGDLLYGFDHD